jgi:phage-related protein
VARKLAVGEKPLLWVGSSREDLLLFPDEVKDGLGAALSVAQFGGKHPSAKVWKGEGPGVLEVVDNFMGDTYRAVYTVRFARTFCMRIRRNRRAAAKRHSGMCI